MAVHNAGNLTERVRSNLVSVKTCCNNQSFAICCLGLDYGWWVYWKTACESSELTPNESSVVTLKHVKNFSEDTTKQRENQILYVSQGFNAPLNTIVVRCFDLHMKSVADSVTKSNIAKVETGKAVKANENVNTYLSLEPKSRWSLWYTTERWKAGTLSLSFMGWDTINLFSVLFGSSRPQHRMTNHEMFTNC